MLRSSWNTASAVLTWVRIVLKRSAWREAAAAVPVRRKSGKFSDWSLPTMAWRSSGCEARDQSPPDPGTENR